SWIAPSPPPIACPHCCQEQHCQGNVSAGAVGALPARCLANRWRQRRRCDRGSAIALHPDRTGRRDVGWRGGRRHGCSSRLCASVGDMLRRLTGHYDDTGASLNAAIEILDVLVEQTDATRRHERADRRRLIGAVDAIERAVDKETAPT